MRLIDADVFKQQIAAITIANGYNPKIPNLLCELIDLQPTAYDVEKVVEGLENEIVSNPYMSVDVNVGYGAGMRQAIKIMRGGGMDE